MLDIDALHCAYLSCRGDHAVFAESPKNRLVLTSVEGNRFHKTFFTKGPAIKQVQSQRKTNLIQKHQFVWINLRYRFQEGATLLRVSLFGDPRLFL